MIHVWPDVAAATSPALKVRDQLDYLVWIVGAMEPLGFHAGPELEAWRGRVQRAYAALVDAMAPGHGDPLPPDVPSPVQPGTWPDVAAASFPGMTIRHQLAVLGTIAAHTRSDRGFPRTPAEVAAWTQRIQTAYDALDHGPLMPLPESARTQPPPPPAPPPRRSTRRPTAAPAARGPKPARAPSRAASGTPVPGKSGAGKSASGKSVSGKSASGTSVRGKAGPARKPAPKAASAKPARPTKPAAKKPRRPGR